MSTSRRNFLKRSSVGLICAGIPAGLARTAMGSELNANEEQPLKFTRAMFAPYLNTTFRIHVGLAPVDLKLKKITDLKSTAKHPHRIAGSESFSLLFANKNKNVNLSQETFTVEHPELGRFSLFLVPVGKPDEYWVEAVFINK